MPDRVTREVEGNLIVTSGSLVCPSPELCNKHHGERYEAYVERHAYDHGIDMAFGPDAERNLGLWCFYYDHKYLYGNPTLTPFPHWEMHAFVAEWTWNLEDLEHGVPIVDRRFQIPPADQRRIGEYRNMKQLEVPRENEKTSIGARAYSIFRSKHEYFVKDRSNYRIIIRSATGKNTRDTLQIVRRMSIGSARYQELYGIWLIRCQGCGMSSQSPEQTSKCPKCGERKKTRVNRISLANNTLGSGWTGLDQLSFRWLTNGADADAVAAYSLWVAGLETETTGQRPDLYIWDDPQTKKNSNTIEKRAKIHEEFDGSVRELEFDGELLVLNTRKYVDDFAGKIREEPLSSLFFSLHRKVRWPVDEPDNPPFVVDGLRYYYPTKGDGKPALNAAKVDRLERQMIERNFAAEYLNDPLDQKRATFKREHFRIVSRDAVPPEIRYGLGREVSSAEQMELDSLNVKIFALNSCDPAAIEQQKKLGDDNFIVCIRLDRHARIHITKLAAGKWASTRLWDEIYAANNYNHPQFNDYEMPASEIHIRDSYLKWARDKSEALSAINEEPVVVSMPMKWSHMPKSTKRSRIDSMESYVPLYILDDAADKTLIEKFIGQWLGLGVADHDDGPDATSRLIRWLGGNRYKQPVKAEEDQWVDPNDGASYVTLAALKQIANRTPPTGLWGAGGR